MSYMKIRMIACFLLGMLSLGERLIAQAPTSGAAMAANRGESVPVNYYTGIPSISIPLYSYAHRNGIGMNVSLDYFAGGIKVNETPSAAGLGWNVSAGGVITRTVRGGVPDDEPMIGYMNHHVFSNVQSDKAAYYRECRDAEQDVFQFNFMGYSGKFFIGSDTSVFITSLSKIKVKFNRTPNTDVLVTPNPNPNVLDTVYATIQNFVITTEDGVKYYFEEPEQQSMVGTYCTGGGGTIAGNIRDIYSSAWYLTKIVSALGIDTIRISYTSSGTVGGADFIQSATITGSTVTHTDTSDYNFMGATSWGSISKVPSEITFPDSKKISFYYSRVGQLRYSIYPLLQRVKIMDSTLIYGYILNWDSSGMGSRTKDFLSGINYFTSTAVKPGYKFTYYTPYFGLQKLACHTVVDHEVCLTDTTDNALNMKDHWGYYNGVDNHRDYVPTVTGYTGANREPNSLAVASTIKSVEDPAGGITYYDFENNDVYPYTNTRQSITINAATGTQNNMTVSRIWGSKTFFRLSFLGSNTYASPIGGPGNMTVTVTNTAGTVTYATRVVSIQELYYNGYINFALTLAPGNYLINTSLESGTTSSSAFSTEISWYNQAVASGTGTLTGGIRIKQIRHYDPFTAKTDTLSTYKYVLEDGKSAGFLGTKPVYDYFDNYGVHYIRSQVLNDFDFSEGNKVGYSRVEVINGSAARNLGKKVFEFTNANDQDFDCSPIEYPYLPRVQRDFAFGLPKRTLTYDNTGRLIQSQTNTFSYTIKSPQVDSFFRSYRLVTKSSGNSLNNNGGFYYPEAGRADLTASADTFYHPDNSITTGSKAIEYDTNYNAIKITTPYDRNRNLNLEKRIYYPYNYTLTDAIGRLRDSGIVVPVSTEVWITGDGNPRLLSATATAFSNLNVLTGGGLIRPSMSYSLQSNAPVPQSVIGSFDPSVLVRNTTYIVPQQSYNYDLKGFLLKTTSLPSNITDFSIYGYDATRTIATVSNALPSDAAYSSFEPVFPGSWDITSTARDTSSAVTGKYSYDLSNGQINRGGLNASLTYLITYWTKGTVSVSGSSSAVTLDQRNGWTLKSRKITGVTDISVSGSGLIDELRLYPTDAIMATVCYEHAGDINSSCDASNNITYYEYDNANRLKVIRNKDKNVVKKMEYSDLITTVNMQPDWLADTTNHQCELDSIGNYTGWVNVNEKDMNPWSETYLSERYVHWYINTTTCPVTVTCPDDGIHAVINGVCEEGCRVNTSSVRTKIITETGTTYVWVCTYHYEWSNATHSGNYTESNASPCTIGNLCD
jgi:hypothetical protein